MRLRKSIMTENPGRSDGRKPLLVYLKPELIRLLKQKAIDEDTYVYLIVEDLVSKLRLGGGD